LIGKAQQAMAAAATEKGQQWTNAHQQLNSGFVQQWTKAHRQLISGFVFGVSSGRGGGQQRTAAEKQASTPGFSAFSCQCSWEQEKELSQEPSSRNWKQKNETAKSCSTRGWKASSRKSSKIGRRGAAGSKEI
jgi:hypothetical protein